MDNSGQQIWLDADKSGQRVEGSIVVTFWQTSFMDNPFVITETIIKKLPGFHGVRVIIHRIILYQPIKQVTVVHRA